LRNLKIISALVPSVPLIEAKKFFEKEKGLKINVKVGRLELLMEKLTQDTDMICGGAEYLLDIAYARGYVHKNARWSLGLRRSCLVVQKENPKKIDSLLSLFRPDIRIGIATEGCTLGLWEEVINKSNLDIDRLRPKVIYLKGCGSLIGALKRDNVDVIFGWTCFEKINKNICKAILLPDEFTIFRSTGLALTKFTKNEDLALEFVKFLLSPKSREIYEKYGWKR
jgi:accessory colonization factor AcfC